MTSPKQNSPSENDFATQASGKRRGIFGEIVDWMSVNKKWWLFPIILAIIALGILMLTAGSSAISPFVYTFF